MRLLLRCDAGPSTGVGHAVRCAAIAEAAGLDGHDVFWSGRLDGLGWLGAGLYGWFARPRTRPTNWSTCASGTGSTPSTSTTTCSARTSGTG